MEGPTDLRIQTDDQEFGGGHSHGGHPLPRQTTRQELSEPTIPWFYQAFES